MATFVQTTLTKRTGATTTVFNVSTRQGNTYRWGASASVFGHERYIEASSVGNASGRRTKVRVGIPQIDTASESILSKPWGLVDLYIPGGTALTDIDDIVGYLHALTASGLTNFDDILVNSVGIF